VKTPRHRKRIGVRMSMPTTPLSKYELFGDPTNLGRKTWDTSEQHLIIEPACHFKDFFEKGKGVKKQSAEERRL